MSSFVEECRREWKRLGVPDLIADEMASDLSADLEEAQAEGFPPEEILGAEASEPRSFAATWARERGVVAPPAKKLPRNLLLLIAGGLIALFALAGFAAVALLATTHTTSGPSMVTAAQAQRVLPAQAKVTVPNLVGLQEGDALAAARAAGLDVSIVLAFGGHPVIGAVNAQSLGPGTVVNRGSVIRLYVGVQSAPKIRASR